MYTYIYMTYSLYIDWYYVTVDNHVVFDDNPDVVPLADGLVNETINYNERLHWDNLAFVQGRAGFGPFGKTSSFSYNTPLICRT